MKPSQKITVVVGGLLLLLAYQNCAPGFTAESALSKAFSNGDLASSSPGRSALSISSPAADSMVSGSVQLSGVGGSDWKNVSVFAPNKSWLKLGADVAPSAQAFTMTIDTSLLPNGINQISVVAFSVIAGQVGGTSKQVDINLNVKNSLVVLPPVTVVPPASGLPAPISGVDYSNYQITFNDEFASLSSISLVNTFDGAKWYNGTEQCCMTDSTGLPAVMFPTAVNGVSVNPYTLNPDGGLNIGLIKQNNVWYSGVLTSVDKDQKGFKQKYGYFEIKAKMPTGDGVWPAFWMLSTDPNLPGEIDIMEYYGHDQGKLFGITLHDWRNGGNNTNIPDPMSFPQVSGMTTDYHTYGLLWSETSMKFYFDGKLLWEKATPEVMKQPYYLLVNMGMGAGWPTDKTPTGEQFQVKYIRAYGPK